MNTTRRSFLAGGIATTAALSMLRLRAADAAATPSSSATPRPELPRKAPQVPERVFEFVRVGHGNLPRVKEMLAEDPKFALAAWDWGQGDWETALGGASHVGNRDIALHLLDHGARQDLHCSAMLGERYIVLAAIAAHPALANTAGPHGYSLLYHAAISGDVAITGAIAPHLANRARDCNQALTAAARGGHAPMTAWLLANGVTDLSVKDALGKNAATYATEKGFKDVGELLRTHDGVVSP
jgi:hypothetical protein